MMISHGGKLECNEKTENKTVSGITIFAQIHHCPYPKKKTCKNDITITK